MRRYRYLGAPEVVAAAKRGTGGSLILCRMDWELWRDELDLFDGLAATFVVSCEGTLRLAPRRSEHVCCAAGELVLAAGEVFFSSAGDVVEISNQSTGFCPEPESWLAVATALQRIPLTHPPYFTRTVIFRRCPGCGGKNIVKDDWFFCGCCDAPLPANWNFQQFDSTSEH